MKRERPGCSFIGQSSVLMILNDYERERNWMKMNSKRAKVHFIDMRMAKVVNHPKEI